MIRFSEKIMLKQESRASAFVGSASPVPHCAPLGRRVAPPDDKRSRASSRPWACFAGARNDDRVRLDFNSSSASQQKKARPSCFLAIFRPFKPLITFRPPSEASERRHVDDRRPPRRPRQSQRPEEEPRRWKRPG